LRPLGRASDRRVLSAPFIDWLTEYHDANALDISIDAAIFDDGKFIGPNRPNSTGTSDRYVEAKQDYYRIILRGLDSGMSLDEAFSPIEAVIKANAAKPGLDSRDVRTTWKRIAAPEA
jgi:hypothetical protein